MDTYEDATTDVQQWISGPFLARTAMVNQVRVLIAGQSVPDSNNIEWGQCSTTTKYAIFGIISFFIFSNTHLTISLFLLCFK
jgi:hypothetical protein